MKLKSKVAIVTGAGSGFGRGIALRLASEGASVAVADLNREAAERVSSEINDAGGTSIALQADVGSRSGVERMVASTIDAFASIDILINNAGVPQSSIFFSEFGEEKLDQLLAVNFKSIYFGAAAVFPHMKGKGGVIVNTTSVGATRPRPGQSAYASSKAAAKCLTQALALELAPFKIRMNSVAPVAGDTPMLAQFNGGQRTKANDDYLLSTIPLGRLCTPADVAAAVLYLVSDEASLVTGIEIRVDGGRGV
jgi:3-oxoacyl-[acyl-carrier protein] reductase